MNVLAVVIRPTEVVRRLMYAHGASPVLTYTNSYKRCRTVKCYAGQLKDEEAFKRDLLDMFTKLELGCPQVYRTESYSVHRNTSAMIVRIPRSMQA